MKPLNNFTIVFYSETKQIKYNIMVTQSKHSTYVTSKSIDYPWSHVILKKSKLEIKAITATYI